MSIGAVTGASAWALHGLLSEARCEAVCAKCATLLASHIAVTSPICLSPHHQRYLPATRPQDAIYGPPKVLFVLGGPGAGKGTQCALLQDNFGYTHLSAGDLLRAERSSGSKHGALINEYIRDGRIVPVEITVALLKRAMAESGNTKFLIDGFPRNFDNLQGWQRVVGDDAEVVGVLFYDTDEATMEARLLERGKTSGRVDDNIESIRKRFRTYHASTMPIIQYYDERGLTHQINAGKPVAEVAAVTKSIVEPLIEKEVLAATSVRARVAWRCVLHTYAHWIQLHSSSPFSAGHVQRGWQS